MIEFGHDTHMIPDEFAVMKILELDKD